MTDDWDRRDWTPEEIARRAAQFRKPGLEGARDRTPEVRPEVVSPDEDSLVRATDREWAPATAAESRPGVAAVREEVKPGTGWVEFGRGAPFNLPRFCERPALPFERAAAGGGSAAAVVRKEVPRYAPPERAEEVVERRAGTTVVRRG